METNIQTEEAIAQKTRELCETILEQPQFRSIRQRVDAFMSNQAAQKQYEAVSELGEHLHEKQHRGETLTAAEISSFDRQRDALMENPAARAFLDAQEEMHDIQKSVTRMVKKTLELGRVPSEEDISEGGSCGSGCGCHH